MDTEIIRDWGNLFSGVMIVSSSIMCFESLRFLYKRVWRQEKQFLSFFGDFNVKEFLIFYLILWPILNFVVSGFLSYVFHNIF